MPYFSESLDPYIATLITISRYTRIYYLQYAGTGLA